MKKKWALLSLALVALVALVALSSCGSSGTSAPAATYTVTYNGNVATGGSVPVDSNSYAQGATVTVLGNTGSLVKTNYTFVGWNTQANGSGTTYTAGQTFPMGSANVTLYAKWTANPTYTVTYNGNNNTGGSVPVDSNNYEQGQTVTVLGNTGSLVRVGYSFAQWNTAPDGSGNYYKPGQTFAMPGLNVTLYAIWAPVYAYAGNTTDGTISEYAMGADGSLTALNPATVSSGGANWDPYSVTVDPSGSYAYVADSNDNTVSQYTIGVGGVLTAMTPATVATQITPQSVTVDPSGKYAYVANYTSGTVSQYTIGVGGALTAMTPAAVSAGAGNYPVSVTVDPSGKYAYTADDSGYVSQYTIGADGSLTAMTPATVAAGKRDQDVTVDPTGKYAYVVNQGDATVSQFAIDQTTGALSFIANTSPVDPWSITVDPSGKYAYVVSYVAGNVAQYTIDPTTGALTPMTPATVPAGTNPGSVAVDPSGNFAYVANYGDNTVSQYGIGAGGALTFIANATAGTGPYSIITTGTYH